MPNPDGEITSRTLAEGSVTSRTFDKDIQSDNFAVGSAGWRIRRDTGNAEFNDVAVRGTLNATDIVAGTLSVDRIADASITGPKVVDQGIDIQRMLNPVYVEVTRGTEGATVTTTATNRATGTFTIPTFVGTASFFVVGSMWKSSWAATQLAQLQIFVGGSGRDFTSHTVTSGETTMAQQAAEWEITSPGATVDFLVKVNTNTSSETICSMVTTGIAVGVR